VALPAPDLVGLAGAQLEEVARSLRLADQVERPPVVLDDGPVGVVLARGRINLEPAGQLHEELDVVAPAPARRVNQMVAGRRVGRLVCDSMPFQKTPQARPVAWPTR